MTPNAIDSPCDLWTGTVNNWGYGLIAGERKAHRVAYETAVGPIPAGYEIDHLCHNADASCVGGGPCSHRRCVNPDHLEAVTHRENVLRSRSASALHARQDHCVNGHPFDAANTYVPPRGGRQCKRCGLIRRAGYRTARATT